MNADELSAWLAIVFRRLMTGAMEPGVANAAANVSWTLLAVRDASEIEVQLAALEQTVEAQRFTLPGPVAGVAGWLPSPAGRPRSKERAWL